MTRNSSKASSDTPRLLQAWCHSVTLGATHLSVPLNTYYTFYNLPRPLSAHYHTYNNPQQLLVLTKHYNYTASPWLIASSLPCSATTHQASSISQNFVMISKYLKQTACQLQKLYFPCLFPPMPLAQLAKVQWEPESKDSTCGTSSMIPLGMV